MAWKLHALHRNGISAPSVCMVSVHTELLQMILHLMMGNRHIANHEQEHEVTKTKLVSIQTCTLVRPSYAIQRHMYWSIC